MKKIFYSSTFPEELRVCSHAEVAFVSPTVDREQMPNLLPRFNRNTASHDHKFRRRRCGRNESCHAFDGRRVGVAALQLRYTYTNKDDVARANGFRGIRRKRQATFPAAPGQDSIEVWLKDWGVPGHQAVNDGFILVSADHPVPDFGEAYSRHQTHMAATDD